MINDWNEQYSPKKTPKSESRRRLFPVGEDDESDFSPTGSPRKSPQKTPYTKGKDDVVKRKEFNMKKHDLATAFLQELDQTVANGQVASMASSAGGIRIVWSRKLNSTAGRANWKRETLRTKSADGTVTTTNYRHHAMIELAEKVIDDEGKCNIPSITTLKLTNPSRPPRKRPRPRILPPRQLHDQQHQKQPTRQRIQTMVGPHTPTSALSHPF